jgi:hypothetical protein
LATNALLREAKALLKVTVVAEVLQLKVVMLTESTRIERHCTDPVMV